MVIDAGIFKQNKHIQTKQTNIMMKTKLLFVMALLVSSTLAWAQTAPEGLSIDTDYSPGQEGSIM